MFENVNWILVILIIILVCLVGFIYHRSKGFSSFTSIFGGCDADCMNDIVVDMNPDDVEQV